MWVYCKTWDRRHIAGKNGDSLCGIKGELPFDYLRLDLEKCSKCQAEVEGKRIREKNDNT